jgi:hypothetical protein
MGLIWHKYLEDTTLKIKVEGINGSMLTLNPLKNRKSNITAIIGDYRCVN